MKRLYHKPEKIIPEVTKEITSCLNCPDNEVRDGQGHCDDWSWCIRLNKEIWNWACKIEDGFPVDCPLKIL